MAKETPLALAQRLNRDPRVVVNKTLVRSLVRRVRNKYDEWHDKSATECIRMAHRAGWL